ncbi:MAG: cyclic nucleotide-binding domain-containing protein [Ardenticatenaceae bacterium]|nr:cyclic nucleotide-binding domain-containing protein [Ardenticatenaceae bacterium]
MTPVEIIENALKKTPLFARLPASAFAKLAETMRPQQLAEAEILFRQGDLGTDMFIITAGSVKVVLADEHGREIFLNEYGPGQVIGELALLSQKPRAATVIATSPTSLLKLTRDTFLGFIGSVTEIDYASVEDFHYYLRQQYKIEMLKRIDWFADMALSELAVIANKLATQQFDRNQVLFRRGDPGDAFYIITQGWVSAFVNADEAAPDGGSLIILNQFGPGDVFGEMALLDNKPRSAGIMALSDLEVLTLSRAEFLLLLEEHAPVALETLRSLTGKLRFAAIYLEKAVSWSQRIGDGDYSMVLDQIEATQNEVVAAQENDDFRVQALLSAFFKMVQGVQQRENELRQEISALKMKIEIDEAKRQEEVQAITQNPFFDSLKAQAQKMREQNKE